MTESTERFNSDHLSWASPELEEVGLWWCEVVRPHRSLLRWTLTSLKLLAASQQFAFALAVEQVLSGGDRPTISHLCDVMSGLAGRPIARPIPFDGCGSVVGAARAFGARPA